MIKNIKDLILAGFMSLSKAEQQAIRETLLDGADETSVEQQVNQQVQKNEIKMISRKRFYEILEKADDTINKRDKERLLQLMEQRGLSGVEVSFKNQSSRGLFTEQEYKFKTDNGIFRFAHSAHVRNLGGNQKELSFYFNTEQYPSLITQYGKLSGLTQFAITESQRKYAYQISEFLGKTSPRPFEMCLSFRATAIEDGVKVIYEEEEEKVMTHRDLIKQEPQKQYTLSGRDFL
jgi:hypothetical protein